MTDPKLPEPLPAAGSTPEPARQSPALRLARFAAFGHTPGRIRVAPEPANESFPFTLDLRRF